jgi:hypothetical protein
MDRPPVRLERYLRRVGSPLDAAYLIQLTTYLLDLGRPAVNPDIRRVEFQWPGRVRVLEQTDGRQRASWWRQIKRELARPGPDKWRPMWGRIRRILQGVRRLRTLPWGAVSVLKTYFELLEGRPCWPIMAELLNCSRPGLKWTGAKLRVEWFLTKKIRRGVQLELHRLFVTGLMEFHHDRDPAVRQLLTPFLDQLRALARRRTLDLAAQGRSIREIVRLTGYPESEVKRFLSTP